MTVPSVTTGQPSETDARTAEFFALVASYRDAERTLSFVSPNGALWRHATEIIETNRDRVFTLSINCILGCGNTVEHPISVSQYANLVAAPRAICGEHEPS